MPLTKEELLKLRYKVIDKYPKSPYKIGEILFVDEKGGAWRKHEVGFYTDHIEFLGEYPNIFQPLPWWSDRKIEDLPDYVKTNPENAKPGLVFKVFEVKEYEDGIGITHNDMDDINKPFSSTPSHLKYFLPATKEEFESYINQKQQE